MEKRMSFILVTYNRASDLEKALNNIREFITSSDELIVIDGGSSDSTLNVLGKNSDIISYFESEKDFGIVHALNKGILRSHGRYLMNLTDDDYFYPDGIHKAINVMEENPEIDALLCGGEWYKETEVSGPKLIGYQYLPEGKILAADIRNCLVKITTGFFLLRHEIISRVGLFDTSIQASDTEYSSRLIINKMNFKYLNVKIFRHISSPNSSENRNYSKAKIDIINIALRHGAWEFVLSSAFTFSDIANSLNFQHYLTKSQIRHLNLFHNTLIYFPFFKRFCNIIFFSILSFLSILIKIGKIIRKKKGFQPEELLETKEPLWDAALR